MKQSAYHNRSSQENTFWHTAVSRGGSGGMIHVERPQYVTAGDDFTTHALREEKFDMSWKADRKPAQWGLE